MSQTMQDSILVRDNTRLYTRHRPHKIVYSSQTTQDSIFVTDTKFYTRHRQHKMLYSLKTTQDSILPQTRFYSRQTTQDFYTHHTHKKDFYTHHRQHTDFYTRHGQHNICIFDRQVKILYSPQTTQNSILVIDHTKISIFTTDDTRFLYLSRTTQDFYSRRYTRHGEHKILFCQRQYKILYSSPTTQDFILVISNT